MVCFQSQCQRRHYYHLHYLAPLTSSHSPHPATSYRLIVIYYYLDHLALGFQLLTQFLGILTRIESHYQHGSRTPTYLAQILALDMNIRSLFGIFLGDVNNITPSRNKTSSPNSSQAHQCHPNVKLFLTTNPILLLKGFHSGFSTNKGFISPIWNG